MLAPYVHMLCAHIIHTISICPRAHNNMVFVFVFLESRFSSEAAACFESTNSPYVTTHQRAPDTHSDTEYGARTGARTRQHVKRDAITANRIKTTSRDNTARTCARSFSLELIERLIYFQSSSAEFTRTSARLSLDALRSTLKFVRRDAR